MPQVFRIITKKIGKNPWCDSAFVCFLFFSLGTVAFFDRLGLDGSLLFLFVTHLLAERFRMAHVAKRSVPYGSISSRQHGRERDR